MASRRAKSSNSADCSASKAEINRYGGAHEVFERLSEYSNWFTKLSRIGCRAKGANACSRSFAREPKIDAVYGHNDPMAVGAYLAAQELGSEKVNVLRWRGWPGRPGRRNQESDGWRAGRNVLLSAGVDKAMEIGDRMLRDPSFKPEKQYILAQRKSSRPKTPNGMYDKLTF